MIGGEIRHLATCGSSNDEARLWAEDPIAPAPHGAVVWTDHQSAGRGRQGRAWHSPAGKNLYFSCILRPSIAARQVPPITLAAGIALCEAVNSLGVSASIKWPNDIWVHENKLAGILTEMSSHGHTLQHVIVGVGLNVNQSSFPSELSATSLALESGQEHDVAAVLDSILPFLERWISLFLAQGVGALRASFSESSLLRNRVVRARIGDSLIEGRAEDIDDTGALRLRDHNGVVHSVMAGEIEICGGDS